jgi:hypothetical protein
VSPNLLGFDALLIFGIVGERGSEECGCVKVGLIQNFPRCNCPVYGDWNLSYLATYCYCF